MLIYITYFIFIAILAIQYEFTPFKNRFLLWFIVIILAFLAGFQDISVSRDHFNYQSVFESIYEITDYGFYYLLSFEPGFVAIVVFFRQIFEVNYGVAIFLFYAIASLSLKAFAINRLSINPYLSLLFYFSYFFLIHEMTQIRIALASGIFLISLISFINGKRRTFVALVLLATCFHYSAIFYLVLLIFDNKNLNKNLYLGLLLLSIILAIIKLPLLSVLGNFDPSGVSGKFNAYVEMSENGSIAINVFNSLNILNILCCAFLLIWTKKDELIIDQKLIIFLKCNILSIFLLSFFAGAPAFSMRFSQLFGVAHIFLFPYLLIYFPARRVNIFILVLVAAFFFYVMQLHGGLLGPFKIIPIR